MYRKISFKYLHSYAHKNRNKLSRSLTFKLDISITDLYTLLKHALNMYYMNMEISALNIYNHSSITDLAHPIPHPHYNNKKFGWVFSTTFYVHNVRKSKLFGTVQVKVTITSYSVKKAYQRGFTVHVWTSSSLS
jgi:hypothetical protein